MVCRLLSELEALLLKSRSQETLVTVNPIDPKLATPCMCPRRVESGLCLKKSKFSGIP